MGMGSSTPAGNTTTTQAPPAYMQPYIGTGLQNSAALLNYQPQYYSGQQVAGFNPVQNSTFGQTLGLDQGLMQGNGNPYENAMFTQAAQAVQPQLASQFAGSGRDITGSMPLASQQLNNLATNFYGNNYQNTVNNAMNASGQAQGIGQQIQNLAQQQIGANQAKYNYYQELPITQEQQYAQNIGAFQPGMSQSNPYFNNPTANALGEGMAGLGMYNAGSQAGLWGAGKTAAAA